MPMLFSLKDLVNTDKAALRHQGPEKGKRDITCVACGSECLSDPSSWIIDLGVCEGNDGPKTC